MKLEKEQIKTKQSKEKIRYQLEQKINDIENRKSIEENKETKG